MIDTLQERLREYCVCDDGFPEQCTECQGADALDDLKIQIAELQKDVAFYRSDVRDTEISDLREVVCDMAKAITELRENNT